MSVQRWRSIQFLIGLALVFVGGWWIWPPLGVLGAGLLILLDYIIGGRE